MLTGGKTDTQTHRDTQEHSLPISANIGNMRLYYELINKSDIQIFRICGHTTRFPEIRLIGPS